MKPLLKQVYTWFLPGMGVKRWASTAFGGMVLFGLGIHALLTTLPWRGAWPIWSGFLLVLLGLVGFATGIRRMNRILLRAANPQAGRGDLVNRVFASQILGQGPAVAAIGGGTGLSALLRGLSRHTTNISAVVTVADSGGSSGALRDAYGATPQGDIRNCLVALAEDEGTMERVFQYRFEDGPFAGHSLGNLVLFALSRSEGGVEGGIGQVGRIFALRGRVIPAAQDAVTLVAEKERGKVIVGEARISEAPGRVRRIWMEDRGVEASAEAVEAIAAAELLVLGPGSLFTSIIPNLLLPPIAEAVRRSRATKVYVGNIMTQPGETDGMTAEDHLAEIAHLVGPVDTVLLNREVGHRQASLYAAEGAQPVAYDLLGLLASGVKPVLGDFSLGDPTLARHDPEALAQALLEIVRERRRK